MLYFAYGSNMSSVRLRDRVGDVCARGRALLPDHRHAFATLGADGTGKGAIVERAGERVLGVVYQLTVSQFDVLSSFEGAYTRVACEVELAGTIARVHTYKPRRVVAGLLPTADYLAHYLAGMHEHGFPAGYVALIRTQASVTRR